MKKFQDYLAEHSQVPMANYPTAQPYIPTVNPMAEPYVPMAKSIGEESKEKIALAYKNAIQKITNKMGIGKNQQSQNILMQLNQKLFNTIDKFVSRLNPVPKQ